MAKPSETIITTAAEATFTYVGSQHLVGTTTIEAAASCKLLAFTEVVVDIGANMDTITQLVVPLSDLLKHPEYSATDAKQTFQPEHFFLDHHLQQVPLVFAKIIRKLRVLS